MSSALQARFALDRPLDLRSTLRLMSMWGATTWLKIDDDGAWYARRTPSGPGTLRIRHGGDHLIADAWGDGAEHVLADTPTLVGIDDPGIAGITSHHPVVTRILETMRGTRIGRTGQVFPRLIAAGLAQKVTGKNSAQVLRRLAWQWGETAPGPRDDLKLLPLPRQLAGTPYHAFHPLGIERRRADLVRRIADRAPALQRAAAMPATEAQAHLEKLHGIGPWTSGVVAGCSLGHPDIVVTGDYNLPNIVAWNLAGEDRADDARMLELLEPYAGHRGLVARMVKSGGAGAPRYGPRTTPRDITKL